MRMPEEIKRGLRCCYNDERPLCEKCAYHYVRKDGSFRYIGCSDGNKLGVDAAAYIEQLERERDAAVKDLKNMIVSNVRLDCCELCKHLEPDGQCFHTCIPYSDKWGWEWRGLREE